MLFSLTLNIDPKIISIIHGQHPLQLTERVPIDDLGRENEKIPFSKRAYFSQKWNLYNYLILKYCK
jgi:hypothetical protein